MCHPFAGAAKIRAKVRDRDKFKLRLGSGLGLGLGLGLRSGLRVSVSVHNNNLHAGELMDIGQVPFRRSSKRTALSAAEFPPL